MQPFRDERSRSSQPIYVFTYNDQPSARHSLGHSTVVAIERDTPDEDGTMDPNSLMEVLIDELDVLYKHGIMVWDAHKKEWFRFRAKLLSFISDYRGLQKYLHIGGSPGYYGCFKCWLHGVHLGGKMVYPGHASYLPKGHPMREKLASRVRNADQALQDKLEKVQAREPPRLRSLDEMRFAVQEPPEAAKPAKPARRAAAPPRGNQPSDPPPILNPVLKLPYARTEMFQMDGMHTLGGDVKDAGVGGTHGSRTSEQPQIREIDEKLGKPANTYAVGAQALAHLSRGPQACAWLPRAVHA
jgi:Transposase family tnp2